MARSRQYPRWRRILMQCVMWMVLAAAVGAAALVNHEMRLRHRVVLDPAQPLGGLRIRLPHGWVKDSNSVEASVLVHLSEPPEGPGGRQLLVLSRQTEGFIPPVECLDRLDGGAFQNNATTTRAIEMAGYPAVLVRRHMRVGQGVEASVIQACVSFPWRQAVVIHLEGLAGDEDMDLVQRIATSLGLDGRPAPIEVKNLTFPHMTLSVPRGWRLAGENDPNRVAQEILCTREGHWISAEVIPCHVPDEQAQAIAALVAANDADWLDAAVTRSGAQWRLDLAGDRVGNLVQARLLVGTGGQGMIAIFRGMRTDLPEIDRAWGIMTADVRFDDRDNWAELLKQGAQAVAQLADGTPDQLLATREDQWWLWYRPGASPYVGWMNLQWLSAAGGDGDAPSPWRAAWELRWRESDGSVMRSKRKVEGAGGAYSSDTERWRSADEEGAFVPIERQSTRVQSGALSWRSVSRHVEAAAPPQFLGGGWFPLLIGELADHAMVLKTESLLLQESRGRLLDVKIRPDSGRRLIVQVNGSGDLTRWSFGADGSLQSIDCARGLRLLAAGMQDLKLDFHDDPRMSP